MVDDSIAFLKELLKLYPPEIKKFMVHLFYLNLLVKFGESMGGMNTLLTALKRKDLLNGLILFAPAIQLANETAKYGTFLLKLITAIAPK